MTKKRRPSARTLAQLLLDAQLVGSQLAAEPPVLPGNLGPSQSYADLHAKYTEAVKTLLQQSVGSDAHVADFEWDGYEARWNFRWELSTYLARPGARENPVVDVSGDHHFCEVRVPAQLRASVPLRDEVLRLADEAERLRALVVAMTRASAGGK